MERFRSVGGIIALLAAIVVFIGFVTGTLNLALVGGAVIALAIAFLLG